MILSRSAIEAEVKAGRIDIDPFDPARLNPASYTFALGRELLEVAYEEDRDGKYLFRLTPVAPDDGGWLLEPRRLYLATTLEKIGGPYFAVRLTGRPSLGLAGLFLQVTADLGHIGPSHRWTLEIAPTIRTHLRPGQPVGQVAFWETTGDRTAYRGVFGTSDAPLGSTLHKEPM
jgi:dCTP deaminase